MYKITKEFSKTAKKYKNIYYKEILGLSITFISSILNGKKSCSEIIAKGIISMCFGISIADERIPLLLEKYFIKTKE